MDQVSSNAGIATRNIGIATFFIHVAIANVIGLLVLKLAALWIHPLDLWVKVLILVPTWLAYNGFWWYIRRRTNGGR